MASRRDHALGVMRRLADERLQQEAQGLGTLRARIARLEADRTRTLQRLADEAHVGGLDTAPYVGAFVRAMRAEEARLAAEAQRLERLAAEQQDRVLERFREVQTYGKLAETEAARQDDERARAETAALAEAALNRWRRG
ncbi:hypothetical protein [Frigidibacter sp. MR17.24]|uniref:hypothetical protein n=1 Tax=Frigidibacter sp. MR17.24 TaxID=3127345 RepID=UPI003012E0F9